MNSAPAAVEAPELSEQQIMFALLATAHTLEDQIEARLSAVGLSMSKLGVLTQLVNAGEPLPLSELAARLSCVRSNMTQLVDRLESDGLVRRVDDPNDRRSVLASVTPVGQERQRIGARELDAVRTAFSANLSADDRQALARALSALK